MRRAAPAALLAVPRAPCRIPIEELWVVEIPLATDEDLRRIQAAAGLPESPLLRSAAAWREALAGRASEVRR